MSQSDDFFLGRARSLNVLMVMRTPLGGLFRHVLDLTEQLYECGHKVGLVYHGLNASPRSTDQLRMIRAFVSLGLHSVTMPRISGLDDLRTAHYIAKLVRQHKIDIIHGHGAKGGMHARLAPKINVMPGQKTARFYTPHGGVLHFDRDTLGGKVFLKAEQTLLKRTDGVIFESAYAHKIFTDKIGTPPHLTRIVHNGLKTDEWVAFNPVTGDNPFFERLKGPADFIFMGEMRTLKGVHILLNALSQLGKIRQTHPTLILAGDGPQRSEFEHLCSQLGLNDHVRFVGQQPAPEIFAAGKILVMPSLNESLPYVIMEACGGQVPLIATDVGGINELFGPTADKLIPANDVQALRDAMQLALQTPAHMLDDAVKRFAHVRDHFNVVSMTEQIEDMYYKALMGY